MSNSGRRYVTTTAATVMGNGNRKVKGGDGDREMAYRARAADKRSEKSLTFHLATFNRRTQQF
jgi:hypothetical protein